MPPAESSTIRQSPQDNYGIKHQVMRSGNGELGLPGGIPRPFFTSQEPNTRTRLTVKEMTVLQKPQENLSGLEQVS